MLALQRTDIEGARVQKQEDSRIRTGTLWSCVAHIITVVIGSGVLSLAWSIAQLGWVAGTICLISFAVVTYISAYLLSECYRSPDSVTGTRNCCYMDAVRVNLGKKRTVVCGSIQYLCLFCGCIAYTITTSANMRAILKNNSYHKGEKNSSSTYGTTIFMLLFGAVEIILSQIPNFHNLKWLSVMAAVMSFSYSIIGFGLGVSKVIANGTIKGGIGAVSSSTYQKVWLVSQGIGDIAFAYPYSYILLEIQDTLKSPPAENKTMKKASMISIIITTFFYLCCGGFGYAAFGDKTPGNLLTGFNEPFWLVDFANVCIVLHLLGAYQMCSQPIYAFIDRWLSKKFPSGRFPNDFYTIKLPILPSYKLNLFTLCYRTLFVTSATAIAMILPYFNQVLGIIGALMFWPLSIYFPVEMYFVQKEIKPWTKKWIVLQTFSIGSFCVSVFALIGSLAGVFKQKVG